MKKLLGTGGHQGGHCFDAYRIISANPPSEPLVGRKFLQLFDEWIATAMKMVTFTCSLIPKATESEFINLRSAAVTPPRSYEKVPE